MTVTEPCDYAACDKPAVSRSGEWAFCTTHAKHDAAIAAGDEPPFGEKVPKGLIVATALPEGCGTEAGAQRHRRAGEQPCADCAAARTAADVERRLPDDAPTAAVFSTSTTVVNHSVRELPVRVLTEHPDNVRSNLGDLADMEASVRAQGILQPLLVTRGERGVYVVIAGHRRLAAALAAGVQRVPVILRERLVGTDAVEAMLVENLQRASLDPLDEAAGYRHLLDAGRTQAQISKAVGKNQGHISQRLTLLNLTAGEQDALRRKHISLSEAYQAGRARGDRAMPAGQRRPKPRKVPHFVITHPQAEAAASACEHETTLKLGVACGPCWERAIRDDERARARRLGLGA